HQNATSVEFPKARKIPTVKRHECRAPPAFLNQPCGRDARATNWVVSFICLVQAAGQSLSERKGAGFPEATQRGQTDGRQTSSNRNDRPATCLGGREVDWRRRQRGDNSEPDGIREPARGGRQAVNRGTWKSKPVRELLT